MIRPLHLLIAACALSVSGCGTWSIYNRDAMMRNQSDRENLRAEFAPLKERIEAAETDNQQLQRRVDELERSMQQQARDTETRLSQMEQRFDAARQKDRSEIIDQLSKNMAEIMARQQPARQPTVSRPSQDSPGTYTVQQGETLSQIAAKYQVKAEAIVEANHLKDANSIRAGQKLIIPK